MSHHKDFLPAFTYRQMTAVVLKLKDFVDMYISMADPGVLCRVRKVTGRQVEVIWTTKSSAETLRATSQTITWFGEQSSENMTPLWSPEMLTPWKLWNCQPPCRVIPLKSHSPTGRRTTKGKQQGSVKLLCNGAQLLSGIGYQCQSALMGFPYLGTKPCSSIGCLNHYSPRWGALNLPCGDNLLKTTGGPRLIRTWIIQNPGQFEDLAVEIICRSLMC